MKLFKKYTREIGKELGYHAAWTPGIEIQLGDVGYIQDNVFIRKSNLNKLGIVFNIREDKTPVSLSHSSKGEIEVTLKGAGATPVAGSTLTQLEAGFSVKMKRENSIFLKANNVYNHTIDDQIGLENEILRRYKSHDPKEKWDKDLLVVTEVAQADSCTILISKSKDNMVDITAKGDLSASGLDIASGDLGLSIKNSKSLETKVLGAKGLVPMFRLSKVKTKLFKKVFDNYKAKSAIDIFENSEEMNAVIEESTVFEDFDANTFFNDIN